MAATPDKKKPTADTPPKNARDLAAARRVFEIEAAASRRPPTGLMIGLAPPSMR
jgi:hypothetical protein